MRIIFLYFSVVINANMYKYIQRAVHLSARA